MTKPYDMIFVGAGIVGTASAMKMVRANPGLRVAVVEKEDGPGRHQTGHNSGVIHSGLYYRPGSLKAKLCVDGARQLVKFCREKDIPFELCGKVVLAVRKEEIPRLRELHARGEANGVPDLRILGPEQIREIEPHARGLLGMHVPSTGIIDFGKVTEVYVREFVALGGSLFLGHRVDAVRRDASLIHLETCSGTISTRSLVNCAGLHSDRVAQMASLVPPCRIVPFRGEYHQIRPDRSHMVRNLIYPVPDPRFPFLGVHLTRMLDGTVEAGPNAVLALAREGYRKNQVVWSDLWETLKYRGFWRMAARYWRAGLHEILRSHSRDLFAKALRNLVPEIREEDLVPGGAGVRAQALGPDGALLDDFVLLKAHRMIHVLNAPSPAATSSLAIADTIVKEAVKIL
ncbi:MAG: L-2-hydroxyglutarate oxidase [Syntrophobacteraceae bacterium]|nr:L-2-hydroxyglutarate oxidase [Syntrophobacteraceae bacterium]